MERQAPTNPVNIWQILISNEFAEGVNDVRLGRPPRYDDLVAHSWHYERGRQWALLAPRRMPVRTRRGRLNPKALALLARAILDGSII